MKVKFNRMVTVDIGRVGDLDEVSFQPGQIVEVLDMEKVGNSLVDMYLDEGMALGIPRDSFEVLA